MAFLTMHAAIIFVVDSNDRERIDDTQGTGNSAKIELHRLLNEDALQETSLTGFG